MLQEFDLKSTATSIRGYHWEVEKPRSVCCLVHGIAEYAGRYGGVAAQMNNAGIAMMAMDLRGHGRSTGTRGHCAPRTEMLNDIDRLIEAATAQYPEIPLIVYGHSLGGNIVLDYRVRGGHAELPTGYIVTSPWLGLVQKIPKTVYFATKIMAKIWPSFQISAGIKPELLGNPEAIAKDANLSLLHNFISVGAAIEGFDIGKALVAGTHLGHNRGTRQPMLLMHGAEDQICSIEGTQQFAAQQGESCTYVEWKGFFHELHNGNREKDGKEVVDRMINWIGDLAAGVPHRAFCYS